ncbi:hypothetical protein [Pseudofrankia sp. BMG5.36]|uniref:hypothetical protein n=1 Tax=Pseudofrankia sp. BMG5.36 TaxID=1834512 RepID=UPI0008DA918D|nr:hypothetical protein [Pseudofrankia sp. BMG5.36]OHV65966.1 hypothetical protein BCD48_36100 [Pseudofrankia sp. BMG5.36]
MITEPGTPGPDPAPPDETVAGRAGDEGVRAASAGLAALPGLPVAEHVAVFEEVNRLLVGTLAELDASEDAEQGGAASARPGGPARPGEPARPGPAGAPGRPGGQPRAIPGGLPRPGPPRPGPPVPGPGHR